MSQGIDQYHELSQPPGWALKPITGGRLTGMTDINPQWRCEVMTKAYGLCGVGWKFEVIAKWTEPGPDGQVFAFADVYLYVKVNDEWSDPIPGSGGNKLVAKESSGLYANDEAFKMAITDALSTAMKMIGVAADVYAGMWDGSKFRNKARDPDVVELVETRKLFSSWSGFNHKAVEDKLPAEKLIMFAKWVAGVTDKAFDPTNVGDFRYWARSDLLKCQEALE